MHCSDCGYFFFLSLFHSSPFYPFPGSGRDTDRHVWVLLALSDLLLSLPLAPCYRCWCYGNLLDMPVPQSRGHQLHPPFPAAREFPSQTPRQRKLAALLPGKNSRVSSIRPTKPCSGGTGVLLRGLGGTGALLPHVRAQYFSLVATCKAAAACTRPMRARIRHGPSTSRRGKYTWVPLGFSR